MLKVVLFIVDTVIIIV